MKAAVSPVEIHKFDQGNTRQTEDLVVVEEPLEIRLKYHDGSTFQEKRLAVTMRTPGNDFELVSGFLLTEGIINSITDINKIFYCKEIKAPEEEDNVVIVVLNPEMELSESIFNRNFYVNSSCGVCGKSSIESIHTICEVPQKRNQFTVNKHVIQSIPETSLARQDIFRHTGGLHASVLLDSAGHVLFAREDIGRHNALDKLVGTMAAGEVDATDKILFISGRAGFELVQKAVVAGIQFLIAVGAPSSLAVELANEYGLTLIGFASKGKFNVYCGDERLG